MITGISPAALGFALIQFVLVYTVHLVRAGRISAHLAVSWVATELLLLVVLAVDNLRSFTKTILGDGGAPYSLLLIGALWVIFLMLESLSRISVQANKLKNLTQEHALLQERLERLERASSNRTDG